jgi:hypothetical protein
MIKCCNIKQILFVVKPEGEEVADGLRKAASLSIRPPHIARNAGKRRGDMQKKTTPLTG